MVLSESPLVSVTKAEKHIEVKALPHLSFFFYFSASQDQIHLSMLLLKTNEQKSSTRLVNKPKARYMIFKWQHNIRTLSLPISFVQYLPVPEIPHFIILLLFFLDPRNSNALCLKPRESFHSQFF